MSSMSPEPESLLSLTFNAHPSIADQSIAIRELLINPPPAGVRLSLEVFKHARKLVSNVYEPRVRRRHLDGLEQREHWYCRCQRDADRIRELPEGIRKVEWYEEPCEASLVIVKHFRTGKATDPFEVIVRRNWNDPAAVGDSLHCHSLRYMDIRSANAVLKEELDKLMKTYDNDVAAVLKHVRHGAHRDQFRMIGGDVVKKGSVAWSKQSRDPRRAAAAERGNIELQLNNLDAAMADLKDEVDGLPLRYKLVQRRIDGIVQQGVVWQAEWQRRLLNNGTAGDLFLLDGTHNTTNLKFTLFTVHVRDEHGSWLPAGHMLLQTQKARLIEAGLRVLKVWSPSWRPTAAIVDDSAAEQRALRMLFRDGDVVQVYLCQRHAKETFLRTFPQLKFPDITKLFFHMLYHARNAAELDEDNSEICERIQGYNKLPAAERTRLVQYVKKNWSSESSVKWATWARLSNPLLMQIRTTSPLEGYHHAIKYDRKRKLPWFNAYGTVLELLKVDERQFHKAELQTHRIGKRTHYWTIKELPWFEQLAPAHQDHLREQCDIAAECEAKALPVFRRTQRFYDELTPASCSCIAWFQTRLPCHHILRDHIYNTLSISEAQQRRYLEYCRPINSQQVAGYWKGRDNSQLAMEGFDDDAYAFTLQPLLRDLREHHKEAMEAMNNQYWRIKDDPTITDEDIRQRYLTAYVRKAKNAVKLLESFSLEEFDPNELITFTGETERTWRQQPHTSEPATPSKPPRAAIPDTAPTPQFERLSVSRQRPLQHANSSPIRQPVFDTNSSPAETPTPRAAQFEPPQSTPLRPATPPTIRRATYLQPQSIETLDLTQSDEEELHWPDNSVVDRELRHRRSWNDRNSPDTTPTRPPAVRHDAAHLPPHMPPNMDRPWQRSGSQRGGKRPQG